MAPKTADKPDVQPAPDTDAEAASPAGAGRAPATDDPQAEIAAEVAAAAASADAAASERATEPDAAAARDAELAETRDRMLRLAAEMENLRRRTEREIADTRQYAVAGFAREMLNVGDNLRRAIEAVPPESRSGADKALSALIEGVEMTERELLKVLDKNGVRPIDAEGRRFDPNMHQAMFEVEKPDVPSGTVVQVIQGGFAIGERVLRPALVGVSKGGPKVQRAADQGEGAGEGASPSVDRSV